MLISFQKLNHSFLIQFLEEKKIVIWYSTGIAYTLQQI